MKSKNVHSIFFLLIMIWFFLNIIMQFFIKNILIDIFQIDNGLSKLCVYGTYNTEHVDINYGERYPFEKVEVISTPIDVVDEKKSPLIEKKDKYVDKVEKIEKYISDYCTEFVFLREEYKAISGLFDTIIGNDMLDDKNAVIIDSEGKQLVASPFSEDAGRDIPESWINDYKQLKEIADEEGIYVLYVASVASWNKYDSALNTQYGDSAQQIKQDNLIKELNNIGIETLDLRASLQEQGVSHKDTLFNTDNHMTPAAGLWEAGEIAKNLNEESVFEFDLNLFDIDNYEVIPYEKKMFGTSGQVLTLARQPYETVDMVFPDFETDLEIRIETLNVNQRGSFADTLIDNRELESEAILYHNGYNAYLYGKPAETNISNLMSSTNENKKVLFLRDSFAQVVAPYIALGVGETDLVCDQTFNGNIYEYIRQTKPDAIVIVYNCPYDPFGGD